MPKAERDAAPAGEACNLALGRRWELRPAGHYEPPARSWLTTGIAGESAARRRDKNAAVERRKASIPIARDAPPKGGSWCASRRSPPLLFKGEIGRRRTRRLQTIRAAERWLAQMSCPRRRASSNQRRCR